MTLHRPLTDAEREERMRALTPAAVRQRRYRARRHAGLLVVPVEIHEENPEELVRRGLLDPAQINDPGEVGRVVGVAFKAWLRNLRTSGCHTLRRSGRP